jgi:RHS repeat-associated protein
MTKVLRVSGSGYIPDDSILFTVNYYDDYGNVIRSISDNHKGGKDIISTNYKPITYEVENTLHLHEGIGDDLRILMRFDYDHTGRLIETTHQINSEDEVVISALKYNEIGDLITKYLHSVDEGSTKDFLQKTDYVYNIRGWLKSINNLSIDVSNDVFGMELYYESIGEINNLVSDRQYNGNIAGVKWRIKNDITRGYGYEYDDLNRLTDAHYGDGTNLDEHGGYYSMSISNYDLNGNILNLKRYFNNTLVDNLSYNYYGAINQLQSVTDNGTASSQVDDYPGTSGTYTYDYNGNMDHDGGKDLDIGYNYLNLPHAIDFGAYNKLFYHFDALGNKLVKYKDASMGTDEVTHYIGEIVYSDNDIDYILTEEGRIVPFETGEGTRWLYEYYMKDHLGNTRVVFNGTNLEGTIDVLQHSSYYPFGLVFDLVDYNTSTTSEYTENKYLYNNKEFQDDMMQSKKLVWYDYGARMYDPQLGRFFGIDPVIEDFPSHTPYNYAFSNPITNIDLYGLQGIHFALKAVSTYISVKSNNWVNGLVEYCQETTKNGSYRSMNSVVAKSKGLESQKALIDLSQLTTPLIDNTDIAVGAGGKVELVKDIEVGVGAEIGTKGAKTYVNASDIVEGEATIDYEGNVDATLEILDNTVVGSSEDNGEVSKSIGKGVYVKVTTNPERIEEGYNEKKSEIDRIIESYTTPPNEEDFR